MTVDRGAIDAQLRNIGEGERWWELREFRELPHVLHEGETITGLARGKLVMSRFRRPLPTARWLFVATDRRLICLQQHRYSRRQIDILPEHILGVRQGTRLRTYQISIRTEGRRYRLRLPKDQAFRFGAAVAPLVPDRSIQRLPAELEPLSWIPGMSTVVTMPGVAGIFEKVSMLSPPDPVDRKFVGELRAAMEELGQEVDRLQQRVSFLEDLLEERSESSLLPAATSETDYGNPAGAEGIS